MDARICSTLADEGRTLADGIITRLVNTSAPIQGTIVLGSGDPLIVRLGDTAPRVIVPLAWHQRPNPVGRDQIARADAVVLLHEDELDLISRGIPKGPIVVIAARGTDDGSFLRTTNPYERVAAATAVAGHPALDAALPRIPPPDVMWQRLVHLAAEAIIEACIACGGTAPSPEPDPAGRR